jgi:hypothetical protein
MDSKEIVPKKWIGFNCCGSGQSSVAGSCEYINKYSSPITDEELFDKLSYQAPLQ